MLATALVYKLLEIEEVIYITFLNSKSTLKRMLVLLGEHLQEAFELWLPGRVLEFEAGFEIPSKFPFIISIDILKQNFKQAVTCMFKCFITVNIQLTQSLYYKDYVATKLTGP